MADILIPLTICLTLTIVGLIALMLCRTAGRYDAEVQTEQELSNAQVIEIFTRKKV
jgi:hypothetical protein